MIKLTLPPKPSRLAQEEMSLTQEFIESGKKKTVWKKDYITRPLLEMSHNKCAYSEIKLNQESTYMEVEHFKHKDQYPEDVVNWNNLLPSCKKCNTTKGTVDMAIYPIVNPVFDNPSDHLYVKSFRFHYKDEKGARTIKLVALNDIEHFVKPRFECAQYVLDRILTYFDALKKADSIDSAASISAIKTILESCGPHSVYSAVIATYLLYECPDIKAMYSYLKDNGLWDSEFEDINNILKSIALPA